LNLGNKDYGSLTGLAITITCQEVNNVLLQLGTSKHFKYNLTFLNEIIYLCLYFFKKNVPKLTTITSSPLPTVTVARALSILVLCFCTACASGHVVTSKKGNAPDRI